MNKEDLIDLFVKGATIEKRLSVDFVRPEGLRAQHIPYLHTLSDMRGWFGVNGRTLSERIANRKKTGDQLEDGDLGRYVEERLKMFDPDHQKLEPTDVSDWERRMQLVALVSVEKNRRALWAWSRAKAGGLAFTKWCKREGIHEMTGQRRKDKAIAEILHVIREHGQHNENPDFAVLPLPPVFWHVSDNIAANAPKEEPTVHREPGAIPEAACFFDEELRDFSWAEKRNETRRQREAEKRKKDEAA